jgi:hypothetical protein
MRHLVSIAFVLAVGLAAPAAASADEVPLEQLPAAVRATVERETRGGRITEIEREERDGRRVYEVEFVRDGREHEILVAEDGKVLDKD